MVKKWAKRPKPEGKKFWDKEYKNKSHLALSDDPSEDMLKFLRFLERESGRTFLNPLASVTDLGCGNGRNIRYLSETYGMRGTGYDISSEATAQAELACAELPLRFEARSIAGAFNIPDHSQTIVLDMMSSHFLNAAERTQLHSEIARILKPGGWFFWKTFLRDEDLNAARLLKENPGLEEGTYIHPKIGAAEHVFTEHELELALDKDFFVHKIYRSHNHLRNGHAFKRRSVSVYAERIVA